MQLTDNNIKKKVIVRQYRCFEPLNSGGDVFEHLWLQNKMWNNLVEYENGNYQEYRKIMSTDTTVAAIEEQIAIRDEEMETLLKQRNQVRVAIRKKKGPETAQLDEQIAALKKELKELRQQGKTARKEAKAKVKPLLDALNVERKEAYKKIYQDSGLYWGNYNRVIDSINIARLRTMKTGGRLRFHRFDGSGRFHIQVQGGCTVAELVSGKKSVISLTQISSQEFDELINKKRPNRTKNDSSRAKKRTYALLKFTIYRGKDAQGISFNRTLDLPVLLHRVLPNDSNNLLLKEAVVRRERVAPGQFRWFVTFTFTDIIEKETRHCRPGTVCGINMGWKQVKDGLRIATLVDSQESKHFVLPTSIVKTYEYLRELQSTIDNMANDNDIWLRNILIAPPENLKEAFSAFKRSKRPHPDRFAKIVHLWDAETAYLPEEFSEAQVRAANIREKILELANLRDKVQGHRKDLYCNWGKEITENHAKIIIDKMNIAMMGKKESADGQPNKLTDKARQNRVIASVGLFREWLVKQAAKTDSEIIKINIKSSHICSQCGKDIDKQSTINWICRHCGAILDQDENAAQNLINAALEG